MLIALTDGSTATVLEEGRRHHEAGDLDAAERIYRRILAEHPEHADSLHLLGLIAHQRGRQSTAIELIGAAIARQPGQAHYHNNLGNALLDLGQVEAAVAQYRIALRDRPGSAEIQSNLGAALGTLGRWDEALPHLRAACRRAPDLPAPHVNLGTGLRLLGQAAEAEAAYRRALALGLDRPEVHHNLGIALAALGRFEAAAASYRAALRLAPDDPDVLNNLGNLFQEQSLLDDAVACYDAALAVRPGFPEAHYNRACALLAQSRTDAARDGYAEALAHAPAYGAARIGLCMAELPIVYRDAAEIGERRLRYGAALATLRDEIAGGAAFADGMAAVGASRPFFLACQGVNDRELQDLYGGLACRIAASATVPPAPAMPPGPAARLRVGIVSGFFREHTIWRLLIRGWVTQLDRSRFEVCGYHTASRCDGETRLAADACDRFVQGLSTGARWRELIADDAPHVLLYPEFGIDPMAAQLATQRLARVQCAAWGHPDTTGLPTIDYFLSSAAMEPIAAQDHYTEQLVRLPNLAAYYEPVEATGLTVSRAELGLRADATVFWSSQALHKYLPQHDDVFPRIARAVGNCQFVFIAFAKSAHVTDLFRRRLARAFEAHGLDADAHCVILPSLEHARFMAALAVADVVLDTPGWSGGKSSLECLTCDLPIVTLEGELMRARHSAAMLRLIGLTETIARDVDDYVAIAVRLARDGVRRTALRARIAASKHRLFRDRAAIRGLEDFLIAAAGSDAGSDEQARMRARCPTP